MYIFIKLAIFILFLLSSVMFFLHCMLNILRYEKIFCEIDESIASQHDSSSDPSYFRVFIVNLFSLLWIFFSRNNCFLWSPCLLLIAESISLDSGKPSVSFFLKITSPSWIILSMSLDELEEMMMNFLEIIFILLLSKNFDMEKIIRVFWRTSLNIIFWILLWMLTSLVI